MREGEEQTRRARENLFDAENILKRTRGQHAGLLDGTLMARKRQAENTVRRRVGTDSEKQKEYGNIWQEIAAGRRALTATFHGHQFSGIHIRVEYKSN